MSSKPPLRPLLAGSAALLILGTSPAQSGNLGKIDFPTSGSPEAQKHFREGVLYLHNFEFDDAREEFQKAEEIDPGFAMAYWGEALTHNHPLWRQVDVAAGRQALQRLAPDLEGRIAKAPTSREKDFLRTLEALYGPGDKTARDLAYNEALEEMYEKYPDDLEIASFYALSILGLTNGVRDHRNYMRAASVVEEVFARNPEHPGAAHYLIHSYDDPIHAPLGLRAARVYAGIAPAASHAQHMISHIYVAMGRWDESSIANETAWSVSQDRVKRKGLGIGQLDFHSFFWLHYSYLQQGRYREAEEMLKVIEEASQAEGQQRLRSTHGRMRAQQLIETRRWETQLPDSAGTFSDQFADALVALSLGTLDEVRQIRAKMAPGSEAEEVMALELEALISLKHGDAEEAVETMVRAAAQEDSMPLAFGPPMPSKPAHELLGEMLLEMNRPEEAQEEFEKSLERAPRRALSLLGLARAADRAGDQETAAEAYATLRRVWNSADPGVGDGR